MQRRMQSSAHGEIFYIGICSLSRSLKPLHKASTPAWSKDQSLRMPTLHACYGVAKTISLSATISLPRSQLRRTRKILDSTSTLVHVYLGRMGLAMPIQMSSAPSPASMGSSPTLLLRGPLWSNQPMTQTPKMRLLHRSKK